jgi:hypothetical protein
MANDLLKLKGGPELISKMKRMQGKFLKTLETALPEAAGEVLSKAQAIVPRKTGHLASTARTDSEREPNKVTAVVAYTDVKAAAVHEGVSQSNPGFKWLERTFSAEKPNALALIVKRLRELLK